MEQCEEVWHYPLHLIGHEHLIAIELYLVALQVDVAVYAWEIEYAREMEWEVHIEVNPEQWLILHRVKLAIELLIVLIFQRGRCLCP